MAEPAKILICYMIASDSVGIKETAIFLHWMC